MEKMSLFLVCMMAIIAGIGFRQFWISIIFAAALFFIIAFGKEEGNPAKKDVPMPLVRPVIVQREYVGPASIYPEKMEITYNPKGYSPKWGKRTKPLGEAIAKFFKMIFGKKKE